MRLGQRRLFFRYHLNPRHSAADNIMADAALPYLLTSRDHVLTLLIHFGHDPFSHKPFLS
jgi:hypothetical protein